MTSTALVVRTVSWCVLTLGKWDTHATTTVLLLSSAKVMSYLTYVMMFGHDSLSCNSVHFIYLSDIAILHSSCTDGEIRLVGGTTVNEGTVEICFNNVWGTICDFNWGSIDASVICNQLGFQSTGCTSSGIELGVLVDI